MYIFIMKSRLLNAMGVVKLLNKLVNTTSLLIAYE